MSSTAVATGKQEDERLTSWKEIASYLGRSVRTVQRWEKESGLPVHRVALTQRGAIYASTKELDEWWASRSNALQSEPEETAAAPEAVPSALVLPTAPPPSESRLRRLVVEGALACLLLAAVIGIVGQLGTREPSLLTGAPVTTRLGVITHPVLSPDGKRVAYLSGTDQPDIYVQALGADSGQAVTTSHRALCANWAPDGKHLAYLERANIDAVELWLLDLTTGKHHHLANIRFEPDPFPRGSLLTWSPDASCILVTHRPNPQAGMGLFAVSVTTGSARQLTSPSNPAWKDIAPRVSPDGRTLAFLREQAINKLQLCFAPFDSVNGKPPACLALPEPRIYGFSFGPDARTVFASLATIGFDGHIWRIPPASPRRAVRVPLADNTALEPSYSAGKLLYVAGGIRVDLREYHLSGSEEIPDFRTLGASNGIDIYPRLSPDETRLAFVSNRSGAYDAWVVAVKGETDPRRISWLNGETAGNIVWSPDGRQLAFSEMVAGKTAIYTSLLNGKQPRRLSLREAEPYVVRAWGRDNRYLYVQAGRWSGTTSLVQVDLKSGGEKVLATGPRGSALGLAPNQAAFLEYDAGELKTVDMQTGKQAELARGAWTEFYVSDFGVLLEDVKVPGQPSRFSFLSFEKRRLVDIGPFTCDGPGATFSRSGKSLICSASRVNTELKYVKMN